MAQKLSAAVMTSIEALLQVPGTQLQHIESTLRQLYDDLKEANMEIPAEIDILIEEAAVAKAENAAYMNGVSYEELAEEYADSFFQSNQESKVIYPNEGMEQDLNELPF